MAEHAIQRVARVRFEAKLRVALWQYCYTAHPRHPRFQTLMVYQDQPLETAVELVAFGQISADLSALNY